jgi:hypothetical protein
MPCPDTLQVQELQSKMSRFHGLTAPNPERKSIAAAVTEGCDSLKWQVRPHGLAPQAPHVSGAAVDSSSVIAAVYRDDATQ